MKNRKLVLMILVIGVSSFVVESCRCPAESELPKSKIPERILQKANEFIIAKTGSDFFYKHISIDLSESKSIPPNYFFAYKLFIKEKPYVNEQIRFITDSTGNVSTQYEIEGIPDCISDPLNCEFVVDEKIAKQVAGESGLAKGIKDWETYFEWNTKYEKYVWKIVSTAKEVKMEDHSRAEGELMLVDPATAEVLLKEKWRVN